MARHSKRIPFRDGTNIGAHETLMLEGDEGVALRMPIEASDGRVCASLAIEWSKWDPFVIEMSVRAENGGAIIERPALRCDVRDALVTPGCLPGLSIGPAIQRGFSALVFQEGRVTLPVIVPSEPLWEFVRATQRLVPTDPRAEAQALDAAYARMMARRASRTEGDEWILKS